LKFQSKASSVVFSAKLAWRMRRAPASAPAPFALSDSFQGAPARARTEALVGRSWLRNESLVAAGAIATVVEKNL